MFLSYENFIGLLNDTSYLIMRFTIQEPYQKFLFTFLG